MDQVSDLFSARLRRCRCYARIKKTSRRSDRPGLDLVECADQFYRKGKNKPAFSGFASCHRQTGTSSLARDRFRAQKTATFDYLPENETGNTDDQITETCDQRNGKGGF